MSSSTPFLLGRGKVSIRWGAAGEGPVLLMVRDTGIGMHPEIDFTQADSLGASLVQALVEQLSGILQLERDGRPRWLFVSHPCL